MASVKVKVNIDVLKDIENATDADHLKSVVARKTIELIKDSVSKGLSPVRGYGRFVAYKDPDKYPGDRKGSRPVNLYLTGDMLNALDWQSTKNGIRIGIFDSEEKKKAEAHNYGLKKKKIPERKFIPATQNERFTVTIERFIRDVYSQALNAIIKKR